MINGTIYTVSTRNSATSLTLSTSAGTQTGVNYCGTPNFADLAHGGYVNHTVTRNGLTVPTDLVFSSDSAAASPYTWDIEYWDNTTGSIVAFILIPTLSNTVNETFYVSVGNSSVSTWQGGTQGSAYDSNTRVMLLTPNGATLNAADYSAQQYTITNHSGVGSVAGIIDGAADLSSLIPNYLSLASMSLGTSALSISLWVYVNDNTANAMLVEKHAVNASWELFLESSLLKLRGASGTDVVTTSTRPANNTWTHVAATLVSGPTGKIYVNGSLVNTGTSGSNLSDSSDTLNIGCYDGAGYFFTGNLAVIRVDSVARSADWFLASYNNGATPFTFLTLGTFAPPSTFVPDEDPYLQLFKQQQSDPAVSVW